MSTFYSPCLELLQAKREHIAELESQLSEVEAALAAAESRNAELQRDKERLDWLEENAGRLVSVRDEPDATICNVSLNFPEELFGGGLCSSLRKAADAGFARSSRITSIPKTSLGESDK